MRGSIGTGARGAGTTGYDVGDSDVIRYVGDKGRKLPAIPVSIVADLLALVHTLHGHARV